MQHEEKAHYIRAQKNGGVRYGFGKEFGISEEEISQIDPHWVEAWEKGDHGVNGTGLGRKLLAQSDVQKLAGIRPLSCLGNFPLIKTYPGWPGLILNTGFGWHGFTLSWKSAQIAAEVATTGHVSESNWEFAVWDYKGCSLWEPFLCWPWYVWVLVGTLLLILTLLSSKAIHSYHISGKVQLLE